MSGAVFELKDAQRDAVEPSQSVWLSASAGTGKTQVLSARVLRLLLEPNVRPADILCLTFTKAGAAEMAVRINEVLARWVRLEPAKLGLELRHIGADFGPETQARARTLFANVLDCPGGGLRIDTIHAFAQWLLANFPSEAEIIPGARPMEDRERELLSRDCLGEMLTEAQRTQDTALLDAVSMFTRRKDPDALRKWVMRCANMQELWTGPAALQPPMRPRILAMLGAPSDADMDWVAEAVGPDVFPDEVLHKMRPTLLNWSTKTATETLDAMAAWMPLDAAGRLAKLAVLDSAFHTKKATPKVMKKPCEADPEFARYQDELAEAVAGAKTRQKLLELADFLAPSLEMGRAFALRWDETKTREGLLDFDDLIRRAAQLLSNQEASDWIKFKLDRQFNHVLVDEAQDTNKPQWDIFDALIGDFFAGEGAKGDGVTRTVFTVGDYKQAIFGFQGTSPDNFEAAKKRVSKRMSDALQNSAEARFGQGGNRGDLQDLDLGRSFRTANVVLDFVNRMIAAIGPSAFGLKNDPSDHVGEERPGLITLWEPVRDTSDRDDTQASDSEEGDEGWLARHDRKMADKIAEEVSDWVSGREPFVLAKGEKPRAATPGDIMVLVRSRKELAGLIVARLNAKHVPVAGVDRLRLGAPLAVKDLMAAFRFAAQPLDDLNLANLLSSPLIGWTQDDILAHVPREEKKRLWPHLGDIDAPFVQETRKQLIELLNLADFETPEALLNWMLTGPWQGRRKLVARLGQEANDPIDELINAAFAYEAIQTPSLAGFIDWFDAGEGELKRDPGEAADLVRVMTVHGSKGLQAPIVILADATSEPGRPSDLSLKELVPGNDEPREIPLPALRSDERAGPVEEAHEAAKIAGLQEHWRLFYVAMTRAEEALFIGGSLSPKMKDKPPHEDSWYARVAPQMGEDVLAHKIWGGMREMGYRAQLTTQDDEAADEPKAQIPEWALKPAPIEARPPRPLAPSSIAEPADVEPPTPSGYSALAARRGVLIHALLERLPHLASSGLDVSARAWLAAQAPDLPESDRAEMAERAIAVLSDPAFARVFAKDALAEVPLSATVGGDVIAGTADRLLVTPEEVVVVDFKTARRPPETLESIPKSTLKQMAAYVAALQVIYPGRKISACVLYTQTPQIFALPADLLSAHMPASSAP
ncbi:MAG: double-strand break repair helicase AddA [Marinomonas sp.]